MSFIGSKRDFHLPIKSVCLYCGSSSAVPAHFKTTAHDVSTALAKQGVDIVYGGGHVGLMGIVADAALKAGGKVTGIIPEHIRAKEVQHTNLTKLHVVPDMHTRKRMMVEQSDAFIILPGGLGTLDEAFEIITWKKLGLHDKPIVIFNQQGFWDPLLALINHLADTGFAQKNDLTLYTVATTIDEVFAALKKAPESKESVQSERM
jgi:uncharacterized protein (TIGR00730 family)